MRTVARTVLLTRVAMVVAVTVAEEVVAATVLVMAAVAEEVVLAQTGPRERRHLAPRLAPAAKGCCPPCRTVVCPLNPHTAQTGGLGPRLLLCPPPQA